MLQHFKFAFSDTLAVDIIYGEETRINKFLYILRNSSYLYEVRYYTLYNNYTFEDTEKIAYIHILKYVIQY